MGAVYICIIEEALYIHTLMLLWGILLSWKWWKLGASKRRTSFLLLERIKRSSSAAILRAYLVLKTIFHASFIPNNFQRLVWEQLRPPLDRSMCSNPVV